LHKVANRLHQYLLSHKSAVVGFCKFHPPTTFMLYLYSYNSSVLTVLKVIPLLRWLEDI